MQNNPASSIRYHSPLSQEPISGEIKFLIACCQSTPTEEDTAFIFDYLNALNTSSQSDDPSPLSLSTVTTIASHHGVLPLVYKTLKNLQPVILNSLQDPDTGSEPGMTDSQRHSGLDPESSLNTKHLTLNALIAELKARYQSIAQRNMLMTAELLKIINLLKENNIEVIAFKGPALAQMAYGDITLRQYSDLDILVDEKDTYTGAKLLSKYSFLSSVDLKYLKDSALLDLSKDVNLYNQKKAILVELHWKLFENNLAVTSQKLDFFKESLSIKINNHSIQTLPIELLTLYLCIHGSKHMWERIEWIVDIDRIIRTQPNLDWEKVTQLAKVMNSTTMLLLGLALSSTLFKTELPKSITHELDNDPHIPDLIKRTMDFLNTEKKTSVNSSINRFQYYDLLQGRSSGRLKQFFHAFFDISKEDFIVIKLPKSLKPLYYIIRPVRLMVEYASNYLQKT